MAEPPFAEPVPVACLFVSGAACEFLPGYARIMAWVELPSLPGEPHEHRIVGRWVMPNDVARHLMQEIRKGLSSRRN